MVADHTSIDVVARLARELGLEAADLLRKSSRAGQARKP
jgi:hypothetical protein